MQISELHRRFRSCTSVVTDSRQKVDNGIFFALKGERFNGNLFAEQALQNGCKFAVVDEEVMTGHEQIIQVENVLETLQQLAHFHRMLYNIPVLAITGSNGKTTTKELIHAVLSKKFNTLATKGNFNNHIGVPLTLLSITEDHDLAVVEMGANHIGEIKALCEIAHPDHCMITNIGKAHLEGFGSLEGVITAKTEMYQYAQQHRGLVFYNASDHILGAQIEKHDVDTISYQIGEDREKTDYSGVMLKSYPTILCQLIDKKQEKQVEVHTHLTGSYNLANITAAFCIGRYFHVHERDIQEAIQAYKPSNSRSQVIQTKNNKVLLDSYNANATSMKLVLEDFIQDPSGLEKVIILGEMKELGEYTSREHQNIVAFLDHHKEVTVYYAGEQFAQHRPAQSFCSVDELGVYLNKQPLKNCYVLLKGSRSMELEKLLDVL